ncbi:MAG: hypothetical protein RR248_06315 [Clostridia bacterium]
MDKYLIRYKKNNRYNKKIIFGYAQAMQKYNDLFLIAQTDSTIKSGSLFFCESDQSIPYLLENF